MIIVISMFFDIRVLERYLFSLIKRLALLYMCEGEGFAYLKFLKAFIVILCLAWHCF